MSNKVDVKIPEKATVRVHGGADHAGHIQDMPQIHAHLCPDASKLVTIRTAAGVVVGDLVAVEARTYLVQRVTRSRASRGFDYLFCREAD